MSNILDKDIEKKAREMGFDNAEDYAEAEETRLWLNKQARNKKYRDHMNAKPWPLSLQALGMIIFLIVVGGMITRGVVG